MQKHKTAMPNSQKKLSNPIASLIQVPVVYNYDHNIGVADRGRRSVVNIQPVVPISLNDDWNTISRTIVPIVDQDDVGPGSEHQFGLGDTLQNFFFSPKKPTSAGVIWGIGPVFLLPTTTDCADRKKETPPDVSEGVAGQSWGFQMMANSCSSSEPAARPRLAYSMRLPNSGAAIEIDR